MATGRRTANDRRDAALPTIEDGTNIGERDTAGESIAIRIEEQLDPVPLPEPTAASQGTREIEPLEVIAVVVSPPPVDVIEVTGTAKPTAISFAEVNHRHPGGEAVVIGVESVLVAPTFRVMAAIAEGRLTRA